MPAFRPRPGRGPSLLPALLIVAALGAGCGERIELTRQIEVTDVTTGWFDAGIVEGNKNKLVPTISLRLRNTGTETLDTVQVNAVFRRVGEEEEWGTAFARAVGTEGLPPGESTPPIVLRSQLGYTGEQPRAQLLQHSQFIDARVEVFGKQGSAQWTKLGDFQIERQLLTE